MHGPEFLVPIFLFATVGVIAMGVPCMRAISRTAD